METICFKFSKTLLQHRSNYRKSYNNNLGAFIIIPVLAVLQGGATSGRARDRTKADHVQGLDLLYCLSSSNDSIFQLT